MAETEPLLFRVEDGVGWIVLNRPEARNAMNPAMREAYLNALARCAEDTAVRAVVLTATGKRRSAPAPISPARGRCRALRRPDLGRRGTRCARASA